MNPPGENLPEATHVSVDPTAPRLFCISGPRQGETFALHEGHTTVGRSPDNRICIESNLVSRQHGTFQRVGATVKVTDLQSRNGIFVNDLPVKERYLENRDQVAIGESIFVFSEHARNRKPIRSQVPVEDAPTTFYMPYEDGGEVEAPSTGLLDKQDWKPNAQEAAAAVGAVVQLQPGQQDRVPPHAARKAHDYDVLIKIGSAISAVQNREELQHALLEHFFEIVPADRGAILLSGKTATEIGSVYGWDRFSESEQSAPVHNGLINKALAEGIALFSNNAELAGAEGMRAVMVVPLLAFEKTHGAIYLDAREDRCRFDEVQLQLFTAIGRLAAATLVNTDRLAKLEHENRRLQSEIDLDHDMVGESPKMRRILNFIAKVSPTDATVLITGESGTGKELIARGIHKNSPRANEPFVAINCAALTGTLLETELFGHEKGAFTGADSRKLGKLEVADKGTVFLDEVGELALELQAKLLRVLQEREFEHVGGTRPIKVDIRVVAATNRDLAQEVKAGVFREDLFYRLNVVSVKTPSLRERREDIPLLASYFLSKYSRQMKKKIAGFSMEARSCLTRYDWPGNVRELSNAVEHSVVMCNSEMVLVDDLPDTLLEFDQSSGVVLNEYHEAINQFKKQLVTSAVQQANGNYTKAASMLGLHPNNLHRLIRSLNIKDTINALLQKD